MNKNRVDFLREKFIGTPIEYKKDHVLVKSNELNISENSFELLLQSDPTENHKYLSWLLSIYANGQLKLEDCYKAKDYLLYFNRYKDKIEENKRDINNYSNLEELYKTISFLKEMSEEELISHAQMIKQTKLDGIELIYEDKKWKVIVPLNETTSIIYGTDTEWCTAAKKSNNAYLKYTSKDHPGSKLYIIIDKKADLKERRYHKYQFHFESRQYRDASNSMINLDEFFIENNILLNVFCSLKDPFSLYLKLRYGLTNGDEFPFVIHGDVNLSNFIIKGNEIEIPLIVHGDIYFSFTNIVKVKSLEIYGDLHIKNSKLEEITDKLFVDGSVWADEAEIKKIPNNTIINGVAYFSNSLLENIPYNMVVGESCYLMGTKIKELPKDCPIKIGKNLYLHGLGIPEENVYAHVGRKIFNNPDFLG